MRTFIRLLVVASLLCSVSSSCAEKPVYSHSNTAITFDVDDVLLDRTDSVPALMWKHKGAIARGLFDFKLMYEVIQLYRKTAPVGAYMALLEKNNSYLLPFARDLALTRVLNQKMACIVSELLSLGYGLHIGTNETWNEFSIHVERYPLFRQFSTYTLADYSRYPDSIQKPDPRYFKEMRSRILAHAPRTKHMIFIDDRTDNIQAARNAGFIGIVFTTPEALEQELVTMNIMSPTCTVSPVLTTVVL